MTINIGNMFAPKDTDVEYEQIDQLEVSLICRLDSYKFSHPFAYPDNIEGMSSYGECRIDPDDIVVPFGIQLLVKRYLTLRITMEHIDEAEKFTEAHFGRKLFHRAGWEKVVNEYGGALPLILRAVPEGTVMSGSQPIYNVTVLDKDLFWMSAGFETMIQRGVWYPTTIATMDYNIKQEMIGFYERTGADMNLLPFALHDFGGRGVTCAEQAEIGGAAHTVNFQGSDTVEGILAANFYYNDPMAAFSVFATEHSIECSFGGDKPGAREYLSKVLSNAVPGSIISIVIDGYDVYREAELLCTEFKQQIIDSGCKVVFRPDSGDMLEVVPRLLRMQEQAFGVEMTDKGYKRIKYVGIIQGDGIDHRSLITLMGKYTGVMNFSADCVIFGSGGALLQKVNRDTLKFAQKASAILVDGEWIGVAKDPVTDHGKKSKEGVLTLLRNMNTGELVTGRVDQPIPDGYSDHMQLLYHTGRLYNQTNLQDVRDRVEKGRVPASWTATTVAQQQHQSAEAVV